ncbi:MAG: DsbA family protein [Sporolactobacillus sp.]|nr:DsbA family protein [Sporolactobacillus sp.]
MTRSNRSSFCEGTPGKMTCSISDHSHHYTPRIEILAFIDPLCPECWGIEPLIKKFIVEYCHYFTLRFLLTTKHDTANRQQFSDAKKIAEEWDRYACLTGTCCDSGVWSEDPPSPYSVALAIKAAEFQGMVAGNRFLRRIREQIFLNRQGLNEFDDLIAVAHLAGLNTGEFSNDYHSCRSIKALQADRKLANEMEITELPSFVFTNPCSDDAAVRINGHYDYDIYVQILAELLGSKPTPADPPILADYFAKEIYLTTREVAVVYDWSEEEALKELRQLQLRKIVEPIKLKSGEYWKYIAG